MPFSDTTALVTGASTGIGREIAMALAAHGATVALVARSVRGLEETRSAIIGSGGRAACFPIDLRKADDIEPLVAEVTAACGAPTVLIHAAGVWHDADAVYAGVDLVDTPAGQISQVLDVGIYAPMLLTRACLPAMVRQRRGKIVAISGTFASGGAGWLHVYVSKLALEHFTVGLAQELRKHEIQVNCVSPSDTNTDALRRFFPADAATALEPREVAALVLWMTSSAADHITGQCLTIKNKTA